MGALRYRILNIVFHFFHLGLIAFLLLGWAFKTARPVHLVLILLTLSSWYLLGIWLGPGYCPITAWHWRVRQRMGIGNNPDSYLKLLLDRLRGKNHDSKKIDALALAGILLAGAISLILNILDWL